MQRVRVVSAIIDVSATEFSTMGRPLFILCIAFMLVPFDGRSCTIVSAVGEDGYVWNMNNEDGPLDVGTFLAVFPRTDSTRYGYYTLAYLSPEEAAGGGIQGGMNEAGLTFDFNAIRHIDFDMGDRRPFPGGNAAIMPYLLGNLSSVEEVVDFFSRYWFENGFTSAQMHVADRSGTFALISASGVYVAEQGQPLVSTNFDICGGEDSSNCWRYPLATKMLEDGPINGEKMLAIARKTSVDGRGHTLYSNVQNLTTGEIWFIGRDNKESVFSVRLSELLARGAGAYPLSDLERLAEGDPTPTPTEVPQYVTVPLDTAIAGGYVGTYRNDFIGAIRVAVEEPGVSLTFANGFQLVLLPSSATRYHLPGEAIEIALAADGDEHKVILFQDGFWSATMVRY